MIIGTDLIRLNIIDCVIYYQNFREVTKFDIHILEESCRNFGHQIGHTLHVHT